MESIHNSERDDCEGYNSEQVPMLIDRCAKVVMQYHETRDLFREEAFQEDNSLVETFSSWFNENYQCPQSILNPTDPKVCAMAIKCLLVNSDGPLIPGENLKIATTFFENHQTYWNRFKNAGEILNGLPEFNKRVFDTVVNMLTDVVSKNEHYKNATILTKKIAPAMLRPSNSDRFNRQLRLLVECDVWKTEAKKDYYALMRTSVGKFLDGNANNQKIVEDIFQTGKEIDLRSTTADTIIQKANSNELTDGNFKCSGIPRDRVDLLAKCKVKFLKLMLKMLGHLGTPVLSLDELEKLKKSDQSKYHLFWRDLTLFQKGMLVEIARFIKEFTFIDDETGYREPLLHSMVIAFGHRIRTVAAESINYAEYIDAQMPEVAFLKFVITNII